MIPRSGTGAPSVLVVVSYFNAARTIGTCLDHLLAQDYSNYRVVVVDAGSTDGSIEIARARASPRLLFKILDGCSESEGQTFGAHQSDSDVIMFTNSDIYVPRDWISRHVAWLQKGYDLVGGAVFWGGDKFAFTWNMPKARRPRFVQEQGLGLGFSNCSTTRDVFARVGGLSDLKSQHDTEFAFRVVRHGGKMILDPEIEVHHDHPMGSFRGSMNRSFGYGLNHVLVMRAVYGRIVSGSGYPAMLSFGSLIREWTCVAGIRAYKERRAKAAEEGINIGLLEFLFIRFFSTNQGQRLGVLAGATKRKAAFKSIIDLHRRAEKPLAEADKPLPQEVPELKVVSRKS